MNLCLFEILKNFYMLLLLFCIERRAKKCIWGSFSSVAIHPFIHSYSFAFLPLSVSFCHRFTIHIQFRNVVVFFSFFWNKQIYVGGWQPTIKQQARQHNRQTTDRHHHRRQTTPWLGVCLVGLRGCCIGRSSHQPTTYKVFHWKFRCVSEFFRDLDGFVGNVGPLLRDFRWFSWGLNVILHDVMLFLWCNEGVLIGSCGRLMVLATSGSFLYRSSGWSYMLVYLTIFQSFRVTDV